MIGYYTKRGHGRIVPPMPSVSQGFNVAYCRQRNREAEYQRFVEEMNARPAACICGENPEYVEDNIYPGEVHRYVVCNGSHPVPHSLSVHGGNSREETIGRWNAFIFNLKNNK